MYISSMIFRGVCDGFSVILSWLCIWSLLLCLRYCTSATFPTQCTMRYCNTSVTVCFSYFISTIVTYTCELRSSVPVPQQNAPRFSTLENVPINSQLRKGRMSRLYRIVIYTTEVLNDRRARLFSLTCEEK
jgi:hypothetical protein